MRLDDFEPRIPSEVDGQKLQFLWAKHIFVEAQKAAWAFWVKIGLAAVVAWAGAVTIWTALHGGGK